MVTHVMRAVADDSPRTSLARNALSGSLKRGEVCPPPWSQLLGQGLGVPVSYLADADLQGLPSRRLFDDTLQRDPDTPRIRVIFDGSIQPGPCPPQMTPGRLSKDVRATGIFDGTREAVRAGSRVTHLNGGTSQGRSGITGRRSSAPLGYLM